MGNLRQGWQGCTSLGGNQGDWLPSLNSSQVKSVWSPRMNGSNKSILLYSMIQHMKDGRVNENDIQVVVVQLLSHFWHFATPWTTATQRLEHTHGLPFTISWSLLKLMSIEPMMPSYHIILYCPFLLMPSVFPSISVFSNESAVHIRWPKYCSFSFSVSAFKNNQVTLGLTGLIFLLFKGLSRVFPNTTIWKHQFFGTQPFLWSNPNTHAWLLGKP